MKQTELIDKLPELTNKEEFDFEIKTISTFKIPSPNSLIFIKDKKNLKFMIEALESINLKNVCFVLNKKIESDFEESKDQIINVTNGHGILVTEQFDLVMAKASKVFFDLESENWNDEIDGRKTGTVEIHPSAIVSPNAFLGKNVVIAAGVKIHSGARILSESRIDEGTEIFPNVVIYQKTTIGKNVRIHSNTVIGSDGFGYNFVNFTHNKIYHCGGVVIEDNVEIGSNSSIDMGTFSPTRIGAGTKLDNLVQVAHNVQLGKGVIICAQSGVAGSTIVGDFTVIGGATAVTDHIVVGKGCQIGGGSGVTGDLKDGEKVAGYPARPVKEWLRGVAQLRKLSQK